MLPGRPPRPAVTKLREGVPPSKVKFGAKAPVESLPEPDWAKLFPVMADITLAKANSRCRQIAAAEWKRVVPILDIAVGLSGLDLTLVRDYCRVVARLEQVELDLSTRGLQWKSERGYQRNPSTILAYQLRQQLKIYTSELGLSPASRGRLSSAGDDLDDDSGFD